LLGVRHSPMVAFGKQKWVSPNFVGEAVFQVQA
jgi:hypothetical protein